MSGKKVFVSYKFWDGDVYPVSDEYNPYPIVRDYVNWIEDTFKCETDYVYKGEHDDEDLSEKGEEYIWGELKDRMADSSVTIVLISPGMKEARRWERSQWIPWEISYSLREIPMKNHVKRANAVLAVVLPDRNNSYSYYNKNNLFEILKVNINNGYIPVITWKEFKQNYDNWIYKAVIAKEITPRNIVKKLL